jgi:hypothetical protein
MAVGPATAPAAGVETSIGLLSGLCSLPFGSSEGMIEPLMAITPQRGVGQWFLYFPRFEGALVVTDMKELLCGDDGKLLNLLLTGNCCAA